MNRKEFFVKTLQVTSIISIPSIVASFLESCVNPTDVNGSSSALAKVQASNTSGILLINIDSSSPLANTGGAALVNFQSGSVLVDHPSADVYNALSSICTHQNCLITNFDSSTNQFVCTCHGSRFDVNGKVVQGPANSPLQQYPIQFSNNQLTIKV